MVKNEVRQPVNLGSGVGVTIKELVETLVDISDEKPSVVWDSTKPDGDAKRLFDMTRANSYGFFAKTSFREGLTEVYNFYKDAENRRVAANRYNVFTEKN